MRGILSAFIPKRSWVVGIFLWLVVAFVILPLAFAEIRVRVDRGLDRFNEVVRSRSPVAVWLILLAGKDPNAEDQYRKGPLHYAPNGLTVRMLCRHGAEVNRRAGFAAPLHFARNPGVVRALLENGAILDARDSNGRSPLHMARTGAVARELIRAGLDTEVRSNRGEKPLHQARTAQVARALLAGGADPIARDDWGRSPLHLTRRADVARVLLEAGVSPDIETPKGRVRPLHLTESLKVARVLTSWGAEIDARDGAGSTPLMLHLPGGSERFDIANHLLDMGASVLAADGDGKPVLYFAMFSDDPKLRSLRDRLFEGGAGASVASAEAAGAVAFLIRAPESEFGRLLSHGADPNAISKYGSTPLFRSDLSARGVEALVAGGGEINFEWVRDSTWGDEWVDFPIVSCCRDLVGGSRTVDKLRVMVEYGADVNVGSNAFSSPILLVCRRLEYSQGRSEIDALELLLANGADPDTQFSKRDPPPLHQVWRSPEAVRLLLAHGADATSLHQGQTVPDKVLVGSRGLSQEDLLEVLAALFEAGAVVEKARPIDRWRVDGHLAAEIERLAASFGLEVR